MLSAAAPEPPGCRRGQQDPQCQQSYERLFPKARDLIFSFSPSSGNLYNGYTNPIAFLIEQGLIHCWIPNREETATGVFPVLNAAVCGGNERAPSRPEHKHPEQPNDPCSRSKSARESRKSCAHTGEHCCKQKPAGYPGPSHGCQLLRGSNGIT